MIAVILKELRQTAHHAWLTGFAALLVLAGIALIAARFRTGAEIYQNVLFHAGIFIFCVLNVALAAHRWKRERGDTALDMMLTTALPAREIIFGKFFALYLPILVFLLLDLAVDHPAGSARKFVLDAVFFAALASFVPALSSIRSGKKAGFEWSGILAFFFALPLVFLHLFTRLLASEILEPKIFAELPLCRGITLSLGFAILGFLTAFAGSRQPGSDRMRDLHIFWLASTLAAPLIFWYFGGENWRICQHEAWMSAANWMLFASLLERSEVTARQKSAWRCPLFATGSIFVWIWSMILVAAAYFLEPRQLELGNWLVAGSYIALARLCGENRTPFQRILIFFTIFIAAGIMGNFASCDARFAWLSPEYFHRFGFSARFGGILFGVTVLLRSREIGRFIQSLRA